MNVAGVLRMNIMHGGVCIKNCKLQKGETETPEK